MLVLIAFLTHCGLVDSIIGGYNIKINEAPYHLSYGDVCGAALIHKKWALTTAHCGQSAQRHRYMVDIPPVRTKRFASTFIMRTAKEWNSLPKSVFPDEYNVGVFKSRVNGYLLGKHASSLTTSLLNISTNLTYVRIGSAKHLGGLAVSIIDHIIHPLYQLEHDFDYDVQLLGLKRGLKISKTVKPITIGGRSGDVVYVSGWGYPEEKGEYHDTLQQVKVHMVPMDTCQEQKQSWYNYTLTDRMFCAGRKGHDACQGDSGGGAVSLSGKLLGLSSFGFGCDRGVPGVYVNLSESSIRNWIRRYTGV